MAAPKTIEALEAKVARLNAALTDIACFDDRGANEMLKRGAGYGFFDEPASVQIAREALRFEMENRL